MARRRKGKPVHGWVVLDKAAGVTSTQAVARVRRVFEAQKAGHGGTLDPLATGLLPVALGEATKTVSYVMEGTKTYRFTLQWGVSTTTDDAEGEVLERAERRPSEAEILAVLPRFIGEIQQVPPVFSAIKVAGERAYDLARDGEAVELAPRPVVIEDLRLLACEGPDLAVFEAVCGKGTYMRALARDLGEALETRAHIRILRRIAVGPFSEADAISLESLEALGHSAAAFEHLHPVEAALDDIPALALTETEAQRLRLGQAVSMLARANRERIADLSNGAVICAMAGEKLVALARYEAGDLRPVRVLNL